MKKMLLFSSIIIVFVIGSCNNDDDIRVEIDDTIEMVEEEAEEMEEEEEPIEPENLFEVRIGAGQVNNAFLRTYYFITDNTNKNIGDLITFDETNTGRIQRPEEFTDATFNLHQLIVRDSSETGESEALKIRINSYLNISPTSRDFILDASGECGTDQEITYNFGDLAAHNYATIYNGCNTLSRGADTENLTGADFESIIPDNQMGYIHVRDGSQAGYYQFFNNVSTGDAFTVNETTMSGDMRLVSPNYTQIPNLVSLRKVDPQSNGVVTSRLYTYGGDDEFDEDLYDFFLPMDDDDARFRTSVFYDFDGDGDGEQEGSYSSIDYIGVNDTPETGILNALIDFNGATLPDDWMINATGQYDVLELQVTAFEEITVPSGEIIPVKAFIHRIRTNNSMITYEKPSIPQAVIDIYPQLKGSLVIENEFLRLVGQVQDYTSVDSYDDYIDALFQSDGMTSNLESLFFTRKKAFSRVFIGDVEE